MLRLLSIVAALAVAGLLWFAIAQPLQVLPRGALLLTLSFLALLVLLWMQVYLQLLMSGGIPR
jgi:hypothetical protein